MPDCPLKKTFVDMHDKGELVDPSVSAEALYQLLKKDEFENGSHVDFYDL
jgi:hypothetical protein